jgi:hypothetical protein
VFEFSLGHCDVWPTACSKQGANWGRLDPASRGGGGYASPATTSANAMPINWVHQVIWGVTQWRGMGVLYFASLRQAVTTSLVKDVTYRLQWAPCCVTFLVNFGDASLPVLEVVCCVLTVQPHHSMCCAAAARLAADLHTHPMVRATAALLRGSHTPSCLLSRGGGAHPPGVSVSVLHVRTAAAKGLWSFFGYNGWGRWGRSSSSGARGWVAGTRGSYQWEAGMVGLEEHEGLGSKGLRCWGIVLTGHSRSGIGYSDVLIVRSSS